MSGRREFQRLGLSASLPPVVLHLTSPFSINRKQHYHHTYHAVVSFYTLNSHNKFWLPLSWSKSSSSRAPGGDTYPPSPPDTTLRFGPHMYPTGDREPLPEDEEEDALLPEPTDFGRPPGMPSCEPCEVAEDSTLLSAERRWDSVWWERVSEDQNDYNTPSK